MRRFFPIALVLGIILGPFIAGCAIMGAGIRAKSKQVAGVVPPASLGDASAVQADSFVTTTATFTLVSTNRFPLGDSMYIEEHGASLYAIKDVPNVLVYCRSEDCEPLVRAKNAPVKIDGRICANETTFFGCRPTSALTYAGTAKAKSRGLPKDGLRLLLVGELPSGQRAESWVGFGISGALLALYGGLVVFVGLRKRKSPPVSIELVQNVEHDPQSIRAGIESALRGHDDFRITREDAAGFTFTQGRTEQDARLYGFTTPGDVPRRTVVTFTARPYHPTMVHVKIEDQVDWLGEIGPAMRPIFEAALARTQAQVLKAL